MVFWAHVSREQVLYVVMYPFVIAEVFLSYDHFTIQITAFAVWSEHLEKANLFNIFKRFLAFYFALLFLGFDRLLFLHDFWLCWRHYHFFERKFGLLLYLWTCLFFCFLRLWLDLWLERLCECGLVFLDFILNLSVDDDLLFNFRGRLFFCSLNGNRCVLSIYFPDYYFLFVPWLPWVTWQLFLEQLFLLVPVGLL